MDLLNHTSPSKEGKLPFPSPWSICQNGYGTSSRQQGTASTTLKPLKWGMGFIEQRPCSHPRHSLILKLPVSSGRASCPTQGKLIRRPVTSWKFLVDLDLTHLKKCARVTSFLETSVGLESWRTYLNKTSLLKHFAADNFWKPNWAVLPGSFYWNISN